MRPSASAPVGADGPKPRVHLMANLYPCLPTLGRRLDHEAKPRLGVNATEAWERGREATCSLALSRDDYDAALEQLRGTEEMPPAREHFEVCLCRDPLPLLPPRCPPGAATCGAYPNDPAKQPRVERTLTDDELLAFCRTARDDAASDIYDDRIAKLVCAPLLAAALDGATGEGE